MSSSTRSFDPVPTRGAIGVVDAKLERRVAETERAVRRAATPHRRRRAVERWRRIVTAQVLWQQAPCELACSRSVAISEEPCR